MITESVWSKETAKSIFLLAYLQSSLEHQAKAPEVLAHLLLSPAVQVLVPKFSPQHPGLLGMLTLFAKLSLSEF